jgi:hypothetical protein
MYTQCDTEGNQFLVLDEIVDWQQDDTKANKKEDKYVYSCNKNCHDHKTTKGWMLCVKWHDGTTTWE